MIFLSHTVFLKILHMMIAFDININLRKPVIWFSNHLWLLPVCSATKVIIRERPSTTTAEFVNTVDPKMSRLIWIYRVGPLVFDFST